MLPPYGSYVLFFNDSYEPVNAVPNIPTASSAQTSKKASKITPQIRTLCLTRCTFLITSSQSKPVPNNRTPMIIKSLASQFTSVVNCIAMNGMSNRIAATVRMMISLLFFTGFRFTVLTVSEVLYCSLKDRIYGKLMLSYQPNAKGAANSIGHLHFVRSLM